MKIPVRIGAVIIALLMTQSVWAYNGAGGVELDDPPIVVGVDWATSAATPPAFFWNFEVDPTLFNIEGPYTFSGPGFVFVTDDFVTGDRFEVFDNGVSLGLTSVPGSSGVDMQLGPQAAFDGPAHSSGVFEVGAGDHAITIQTVEGLNSGRGYIKVEEVPEPSTIAAIVSLGFVGVCVARRRRRNRK